MTRVNWTGAAFLGATMGGVIWAIIVRLTALEIGVIPWQARLSIIAGVVNAVLLLTGLPLWRSPEQLKTLAMALWTVPIIGLAFFAAAFTAGTAGELFGS
jgi:hypothetical protein